MLGAQEHQWQNTNNGSDAESDCCLIKSSKNNITNFYKGAVVFITGATGFVGKALVEKLLRSCESLDSICLLMRPKKGLSIEQRLEILLKSQVFDKIRTEKPDVFIKVKAIAGDVAMPDLALTDTDKTYLLEHTNIVLHSAATVKFNEDLKNAVIINTLGTKRVLELCEGMRNLKSFVHVSTAFSNSDKNRIDETVYEPPYDPNVIINCVEVLPQDVIDVLSKRLLGNHPNTYTFTKAMAEYIVKQHSATLPVAIVRPSIITASWKEPFPGWVDNMSGITGIFMECGRGTIKSILCNEKYIMDLIPVDIVVNTILTAAWHTAAYQDKNMRVYNCVTGPLNPITWKEFGDLTHTYVKQYPSKYVQWYPGFTYRTNRLMHVIIATLYHTIPSAVLDALLICTNRKPIMLKISNKFYHALDAGKFFSTNEFEFMICTMKSLIDAVKNAEDGMNFPVSMHKDDSFQWKPYVEQFMLGVRQYVLKDDLSSLPSAKAKLQRLYWLPKIFQAVSLFALYKFAAR